VDGLEAHLTPTEYELLKYLALHVGKVVTHRDLPRAVWGPEYEDAAHYLRVCVGHLRRKIEPEEGRSPRLLLTELGIGYRLRGTPRLQRCAWSMLGEHLENIYARSLAFRFPLPSCTELRRCGALPGALLRLAK
jgi:DNA-binding winged helix-turn-helix (wHTH) protein